MKRLLLLLLIPSVAFAQTKIASWEAPTKRENGDPLPANEIKEYRLYNKRKLYKTVPAPTVSTSVSMISSQTYAWEVTAVDTTGLQSKYSNAVVFQPTPIPTLQWPPAEAQNLTVK